MKSRYNNTPNVDGVGVWRAGKKMLGVCRAVKIILQTLMELECGELSWRSYSSLICRVGQNHIYTVYIRHFLQGFHQIYGHIRRIYTVLAHLTYLGKKKKWGGVASPNLKVHSSCMHWILADDISSFINQIFFP